MDLSRLRRGELIAAAAGVALLIVMFLPWFSISIEDFGEGALPSAEQMEAARILAGSGTDLTGLQSVGFSAWQVLTIMDLFFFVTAAVAVGLALVTGLSSTVSVPVATGTLTAALGGISTLLVLLRILVPPAPYGTALWIWVGLIAAAAIAIGGWISMQEEDAAGAPRSRGSGDPFDDGY